MPRKTGTIVLGERDYELVCHGAGTDWLCRLTDPSSQPTRVVDSSSPPPDDGFFWFREVDHMWFASGMVRAEVAADADSVDAILYAVMEQVLGHDDQLASLVQCVDVRVSHGFDGEGGPF
jgi:hypothetical protein